jgi:putative ABC transport system permease protein
VTGIWLLLSKDFIKLILLAAAIATPLCWWTMNVWLQGFAYRIAIGPLVFLEAGLIALAVALATIGWQAVKAALANPIRSLRSE